MVCGVCVNAIARPATVRIPVRAVPSAFAVTL